MAYRNTLQADALKLVGKKLQSSLAVEGELPEDGLDAYGDDDDGDDLMLALTRKISSASAATYWAWANADTWRNGYRPRRWDTRAGSIELQIPKLRQGSYFPALLEPRRRAERALLAVVQQAYVEGVSTRRVDDLVRSLGCEGISQEPGVEDLRRARRRRRELPRAAARRRSVPLPLARRAHPAGARGGPHRAGQPCGVSPRTRVGWSPPPSMPQASVRCWASTSARARTGRHGSHFCAGWWRAGSPAWSS